MKISDFVNSGINSPAQAVDIFSLCHETMSALMFNRSKFGTPKGYGHTPFFQQHAVKWVRDLVKHPFDPSDPNDPLEHIWYVRYRFVPKFDEDGNEIEVDGNYDNLYFETDDDMIAARGCDVQWARKKVSAEIAKNNTNR